MMQVHATRNIEKKTGISTVQRSILFLDPSNTIDRASTVSGKSMLRREVIITVTYWVNRIMSEILLSTCTDP